MNRIVNKIASRALGVFVAHGVHIDAEGRLCFPDGLTPERVKRFIELCVDARYDSPRAAMHDLFLRVGVSAKAVGVLERILAESGDVDLGAVARHWRAVLAALPALHQIPTRFREFLVADLEIASPESGNLESAVVSARETATARLGCEATWDAILEHPDGVAALAAPWRARQSATSRE